MLAYNAGVVGRRQIRRGGTIAPYTVLARIGAKNTRWGEFPHDWGYAVGLRFLIRLSDEPLRKSVASGVKIG